MRPDRPTLGIALMLGFCLTVPFADAFAKLAGAVLPLAMLVLARLIFQAAVLSPLALRSAARLRIPPGLFGWVFLRSLLNLAGHGVIYASFRFLPLADAIAIAYVMPFILLFLARQLMGEEVGPRRVIAAIAGFAGTLMVVQPAFAEVGLPALLPVLGAVLFALFILVTRRIAREIEPVALQAVSGWIGLATLLPLMALALGLGDVGLADLAFAWPSVTEAWLLVGIGLFGTLSHVLMAASLRFAPSATVAPVQYLEIPVAACVGWLFFREFPNGLALAGIAVILAAGLYIVFRERELSRAQGPQGVA